VAVVFKELQFNTARDPDVIDITSDVQSAVIESGLQNGIVNIFVTGSTASVSTIEYEPNLVKDLSEALERIVPSDIRYHHHMTWGDDNGKSHIRATLFGPGTSVPFKDSRLILGTWQQLVVIDFDTSPRKRRVQLTVIGE
jgi:secondary thiamine-phosphate synthase enzyme